MRIEYVWHKALKKIRGKAIKNSKISKDGKIGAGSTVVNSVVGRFSYCGYDCLLSNVEIGAFCSIAEKVVIGGGNHPLDWVSTSTAFYRGRDSLSKRMAKLDYNSEDAKTIIGNDVWIGQGAYIKAGVVIGDGAVIGMGSVVTKDVSPYSIVAGNPAKEIRKRFNDDVIKKLLNIKWWEMSEEQLTDVSKWFSDVDMFIDKLKGADNV